MRQKLARWLLMPAAHFMLAFFGGTALAATVPLQTMTPKAGEIEKITINNPADVWSGGTMTVGGEVVILPRNLLINLPNDYQTLQQLYANAPVACKATGETGLAKTDRCNGRATGAQVDIKANRTLPGNNVIAGQVDVFKGLEVLNGTITYINYTDGYFRVNGNLNDSATGTMVRVNDPTSRHTVQSGPGCAAGSPNCSPDVRFKVDPDNYTFAYATGYPPCIPTTANGQNDVNCPQTNRPAQPVGPGTGFNNAAVTSPPPVPDSTRFAPIKVGDAVTASGSFETVNGVTFISASAVRVQVDLTTRHGDPTQPDYLFINEASWDGPAYPAGRVRGRLLTTATDHQDALNFADIDYFSVHYDPVTNSPHEQILYTTQFNKKQGAVAFGIPNGVYDSQIRMDFFPGAKVLGSEPCQALRGVEPSATGTPNIPGVDVTTLCRDTAASSYSVDNFNLMVPAFREVMARSHRTVAVAAGVTARDIHGNPTQFGQYKLPTVLAYGAFEDINLALFDFPFQFSGTPWLMDRRLSPNGCIPAGQCEASPQPLDPFPFEGYDPRLVSPDFGVFVVAGGGGGGGGGGAGGSVVIGPPASGTTPLPNPDRVLAFWPFGTRTSNPNVLAWPPAPPQAFPITPTPELNLFSPVAANDTAITNKGVSVTIDVLANDVPVMGTIDPATLAIVSSNPANGTPTVNTFNGRITYTPVGAFAGTDTFTYKVANNMGAYSNAATVTVTVAAPPVAGNDPGFNQPGIFAATGAQISINVIANDTSVSSNINPTSVNVVSHTCGTVFNPANGTLLFTAPATVPAAGVCTIDYVVYDSFTPPQMSNTATVTVTISPGSSPVAVNDTATTTVGLQKVIDVLANDTPMPGNTIDPTKVALTLPVGVNAAADPNSGLVTFNAPPIPGIYSFSYTVKDNTGALSNSAIVTVTVTSTPPTAGSFTVDPVSAGASTSIAIVPSVPSHVTPGSNPINPASLAVVQPANGSVVAFADGTVTYTPAPGYFGAESFTYTVRDTLGTLSNSGTVTLNVTAPGEVLTVTTAQFVVSGAAWQIEGASTTHTGSVDIYNNTAVGTGAGDPTYLGTASINSDGTWSLLKVGPQPLDPNLQISVKSSNVTSLTGVTLVVR